MSGLIGALVALAYGVLVANGSPVEPRYFHSAFFAFSYVNARHADFSMSGLLPRGVEVSDVDIQKQLRGTAREQLRFPIVQHPYLRLDGGAGPGDSAAFPGLGAREVRRGLIDENDADFAMHRYFRSHAASGIDPVSGKSQAFLDVLFSQHTIQEIGHAVVRWRHPRAFTVSHCLRSVFGFGDGFSRGGQREPQENDAHASQSKRAEARQEHTIRPYGHVLLSMQVSLGILGVCISLWWLLGARFSASVAPHRDRNAQSLTTALSVFCLVFGGGLALLSVLRFIFPYP